MQSLRQLGGGVIIAIISILLVIGGISLALAETLPPQATPTPIPPTISLDFPTATFTPSLVFPETTTETATATLPLVNTDIAFATNTLYVQPSCNPPTGWVPVAVTTSDSLYSLAQRYKTTPENLGAANCLSSFDVPVGFVVYVPFVPTVTVVPCGPPAGYVRRYVVRPGDTLSSIARLYGITYTTLQRANCMGSSTTIYSGQLLWVPNIMIILPTRTAIPGITLIPNITATNTYAPPPPPSTLTPSVTPVTPKPTIYPNP
jgi:LysM repeat protein